MLWLVLFKLTIDLPTALADNNLRILNLVPFADYTADNIRELIYNFLVFIPFGLFLGVNLKRASFWQKLAFIFAFSVAVETIQYALALGAADISDVISNTSGGLIGLLVYALGKKYFEAKELDQYIVVGGMVLLVSSVSFLGVLFASGVRFQSPLQPGEQPPIERRRSQ